MEDQQRPKWGNTFLFFATCIGDAKLVSRYSCRTQRRECHLSSGPM
jgi:hypothetical protein